MAEVTPKTRWVWLLGTFFGIGYLKPGPGTYASAVTAALWLGSAVVFHPSPHAMLVGTIVAALVVTAIGIPISTIVARESGRKDPQIVVIDEVAGQLITLIAFPATWPYALLALGLFRAFDIAKPWPIRQIEKLPGGMGIMLDDVAAGVIARFFAYVVIVLVHYIG